MLCGLSPVAAIYVKYSAALERMVISFVFLGMRVALKRTAYGITFHLYLFIRTYYNRVRFDTISQGKYLTNEKAISNMSRRAKKMRIKLLLTMNDIARNPEFDRLVASIQELETELAALVHERDKLLYHICPMLQTEYMLKIGKLEYSIFEYQCKILRAKRKIELIRTFLNREQPYNIAEIEKQLDREHREYSEKLLEKQKEIEKARLTKSSYGRLLTKEEEAELKKLYTLIVKKLHPDINPNTTEEQHGYFIDAVNAYKNADLSELRVISLLLEKTSVAEKPDSMDKLQKRKEMLLNEKEYLLSELHKIKESFPYNVKKLLENDANLQQKIEKLSELLTELHISAGLEHQ